MQSDKLRELRAFAKRRLEGAQKKLDSGPPSSVKFQQGRREMALAMIHEIDRLLATDAEAPVEHPLQKFADQMKPLEAEYGKLLNDHFWELLMK